MYVKYIYMGTLSRGYLSPIKQNPVFTGGGGILQTL